MKMLCKPTMLWFIYSLLTAFEEHEEPIPILILKAPHSGSSWMASEINRYKGVFIQEEIFIRDSYKLGNALKESQSYLLQSFRTPMPQYGEKNLIPKDDYKVLGATLNPYWGSLYVDWNELAKKVPQLRLIIYVRTNKIKHAVASLRAHKVWKKCDVYVARSGCKLDPKFYVNISNLQLSLEYAILYSEYAVRIGLELAAKLENWFWRFSYEELIGDPDTLDRLFKWMGYNATALFSKSPYGKRSHDCTKSTHDNLKEVILNYDEVESYISYKYPCLLSHLKETEPGKAMPSPHETCSLSVYPDIKKIEARDFHHFNESVKEWFAKH